MSDMSDMGRQRRRAVFLASKMLRRVEDEVDDDGVDDEAVNEVDIKGAGEVDEAGTVKADDWSCNEWRTFTRVSPSNSLSSQLDGWAACK